MTIHTHIEPATAMRLYIGRRDTGIIIHPDGQYRGMWRIHWSDGDVSPMANLARVKDAARVYAVTVLNIRGAAARWGTDVRAVEAPPAAVSDF